MTNIDDKNQIFHQAVSFVNHTNKSIFLTGKAGTGKTTFLKYIKEHSPKKLAIIAPTGVAAINAGGTTIHSFFQLPFGTFIPTEAPVWGGEVQQVYNKTQLLRNQRLRQPQRKLIQSLELLIIDEVSMLRSDVLDAMDTILRSVRRQPYAPFGGVQLLFIGDMYQLPPVIKQSEISLMNQNYGGPFFFNAQVMESFPILYIELKKIYRQKDHKFIQLLENVRNNCCGNSDYEILQELYKPQFSALSDQGFITLTTHNYKADTINKIELEKLPGSTVQLKAKIDKNFPENAYPVDENLNLKIGAQVMFIKNDKGENRRYFNGKIGKVTKLDVINKTIQVLGEGDADPIDLEIEVWKNIKYEYDKEKDKVNETELGSFQQYPIRLAWAVTIHKSQGLTFEKAIIDAGQSFAPGQVYVALSRLTNLSGLILHSPIQPRSIMVDSRILHFSNQEINSDALGDVLDHAQHDFARDLLFKAYDFEDFTEEFREHSASYYEKQIPDRPQSFAWSEQILSFIYGQQSTAQKFSNYLQTWFQQNEINYNQIHQRNIAASAWFIQELNDKVIASIKTQIIEQKGKPRTKKYVSELEILQLLAERKKQLIERSLIITAALNDRTNMQDAFKQFTPNVVLQSSSFVVKIDEHLETYQKKTIKKSPVGSSKLESLKLHLAGKTIEVIAQERGFSTSTIEGHLISFIPEGKVSVDYFADKKQIQKIKKAISENPTATSGAIKTMLGDDISYVAVRAVMKLEEKENA